MNTKSFFLLLFLCVLGCTTSSRLSQEYDYPMEKTTEAVKTTMEKLGCDSVIIYEKGETPHILFVRRKDSEWFEGSYDADFLFSFSDNKTSVTCNLTSSYSKEWVRSLIFPALTDQINIEKTGILLSPLPLKDKKVFNTKCCLFPVIAMRYAQLGNPYVTGENLLKELLYYGTGDIIGVSGIIYGICTRSTGAFLLSAISMISWRISVAIIGGSEINAYNEMSKTGYNFGLIDSTISEIKKE